MVQKAGSSCLLNLFYYRINPKREPKIIFLEIRCTYMYICIVKLEQAIQSNKFKDEMHKASLNILYTAWWLKTRMSNELKGYGLTHEQYNVLRILKGKHPEQMCVKNITCRMIERSSNVPRIIDRLEIKKLVKRSVSPTDRRETVITLTQSGLTILEASTEKINALMEDMVKIETADAKQLNELLEKLRGEE